MVLVTLAWMTHFPGCQNCLDVTTWYATILTDGETDKLLLLRNILMQIGSWWVGSDYLDENGCSGTIKVRNSRPVHVPGPIGSNRSGYGSGIPDLIGPTVDESGWQWITVDESGTEAFSLRPRPSLRDACVNYFNFQTASDPPRPFRKLCCAFFLGY